MRNVFVVLCVMGWIGSAEAKAGGVTILEKDVSKQELVDPGETRGKVLGGLHWKDDDGDNVFFLSLVKEERTDGMQTRVLYVSRYLHAAKEIRLVRSAHEIEEKCPEDAVLDASVLGVFDEDRDGRGEVVFGIRSGCVSDMSPVSWTLHVWEGPSDFALFGTQIACEEDVPEEKDASGIPVCRKVTTGPVPYAPYLGDASPRVRDLALRLWAEHVPILGFYSVPADVRARIRTDLSKKLSQ